MEYAPSCVRLPAPSPAAGIRPPPSDRSLPKACSPAASGGRSIPLPRRSLGEGGSSGRGRSLYVPSNSKPRGPRVFYARPLFSCFTEWSLDRSLPHITRYGRLGLGFPKRVVLLKGGQPVSYFKSTGERRRYAETMLRLIRFFEKHKGGSETTEKRMQDLKYLLSFSRAIREEIEPKKTVSQAKVAAQARAKRKWSSTRTRGTKKAIDPYSRKFGLPLDSLKNANGE